jgi:acylaminoacyl-peptidase
MVRDLATGRTREIAPRWDRSPHKLEWSRDGRTLFADAQDIGKTRLSPSTSTAPRDPAHRDGRGGQLGPRPRGPGLQLRRPRQPGSALPHGLDGGQAVQLTRHNADKLAGLQMGQYEQFSFRGWNNETVYGYLVRPVNYQPGRKYPSPSDPRRPAGQLRPAVPLPLERPDLRRRRATPW